MDTLDYTQYLQTKTVTVREVFEAIKENGFEHLRREWLQTSSDGKVIAGCVLGQAGVNLGVLPSVDLVDRDYPQENFPQIEVHFPVEPDYEAADEAWNKYNLEEREHFKALSRLQEFIQEHSLEEQLNNIGESALGQDVIYLNDAMERNPKTGRNEFVYSWDKVVIESKNLLQPHFDKKITLIEWTP